MVPIISYLCCLRESAPHLYRQSILFQPGASPAARAGDHEHALLEVQAVHSVYKVGVRGNAGRRSLPALPPKIFIARRRRGVTPVQNLRRTSQVRRRCIHIYLEVMAWKAVQPDLSGVVYSPQIYLRRLFN